MMISPKRFLFCASALGAIFSRDLKRGFLLLTALLSTALFSQLSLALEISASVDRDRIALSETLTLTVTIDEQVAFSAPSFTELSQNFDILRQHKSNRYQSMNGRVSSVTEWVLTLGPKREGQLIIPSFEYEGEFSQAIPIKVSPEQAQSSDAKTIFVESSTDKQQAFVQEQIIFTQKLYSAVNISSFDPEPLQLDQAKVELLAEFDYQTRINGKPYIVVESRYAIYPQQSGRLTIPSLRWSIGVSGGRRNVFDPFNNSGGRIHRLATKTIELDIKASPAQAQPWLPARSLTLSQRWSADPSTLRVGEPITRHIELSADGLTAAQLPNIDMAGGPELQGKLKTYAEPAQTRDDKSNSGIRGVRELKSAIIASQAGPLTLPAITLRWWNTESQQWQDATLAPITVNVEPALNQAPAPVAGLPNDTQAQDQMAANAEEAGLASEPQASTRVSDNGGLSYLLLAINALLCLALIVLAAGLWRKNRQLSRALQQAQSPAQADTSKAAGDIDWDDSTLQQATDARAQFSALQNCLHTMRQNHANFNQHYSGSELHSLINGLEAELFGADKHTAQAIDPEQLQNALKHFKDALTVSGGEASALPPLYPH